jgi:putative tricarboxylic transport membrane protein
MEKTIALKQLMQWTGGALFCAAAAAALAQPAWRPEKAVEIVTPSAAGGANDKVARTLQKSMQDGKLVPVPVSVVNRAGGNQTLSRIYLSQHAGDAHYFDIGTTSLLSNYIMGVSQLKHTDFTPIALMINEYAIFTVKADSPMRTVGDMLARLKKDPESVSIGVSNLGGTSHLAAAIAAKSAGVDPKRLKIVVFKSASEAATAVLGGHLDMVSGSVASVNALAASGQVRIIAISSPRRQGGLLATVPTLRESGVAAASSNWRAIIGAKGLSATQVAYWEAVFAKAAQSDVWKAALTEEAWEGNFMGSREFGRYLDTEYADYREILKDLGLARQ